MGWSELEGIANRTDFDLKAHSRSPENPDAVGELTLLRPGAEEAHRPVRHRAVGGRRPRDAGVPVRRLRRVAGQGAAGRGDRQAARAGARASPSRSTSATRSRWSRRPRRGWSRRPRRSRPGCPGTLPRAARRCPTTPTPTGSRSSRRCAASPRSWARSTPARCCTCTRGWRRSRWRSSRSRRTSRAWSRWRAAIKSDLQARRAARRLRRHRRHRQALPAPGRDRHAVLHHRRLPEPRRRDRHRARPRHHGAGAGRRRRAGRRAAREGRLGEPALGRLTRRCASAVRRGGWAEQRAHQPARDLVRDRARDRRAKRLGPGALASSSCGAAASSQGGRRRRRRARRRLAAARGAAPRISYALSRSTAVAYWRTCSVCSSGARSASVSGPMREAGGAIARDERRRRRAVLAEHGHQRLADPQRRQRLLHVVERRLRERARRRAQRLLVVGRERAQRVLHAVAELAQDRRPARRSGSASRRRCRRPSSAPAARPARPGRGTPCSRR